MPRSRFLSKNNRRNLQGKSRLQSIPSHRLKLVFLILCMGLSGLLVRLAWLQTFQSPLLQSRARAFQTEKNLPLGIRRSIVDRRGKLVALDEKRFRLWAHPKYFMFPGDSKGMKRSSVEVAQKLAIPLGTSIEKLSSLLKGSSSGVRLAEGLSPEVASEIRSLHISGLDLEPYAQRIYPQGDLFANVIGFLDYDRIPQAGLEQSLNQKFYRKEKAHHLRRGADGTPLPDGLELGVFNGDDFELHLTLDGRLQEVALKALQDQVSEWGAEKGVAIVMDSSNGELLALASTPSYDPNKYWEYSPTLYREWSVQDLFEPGSVFKPINLLLALEEGVVNSSDKVNDSGVVRVGGWPLKNWDEKANGVIDFATVLQVSSNVGMVKIMRKLSPSSYWEWLHKLGLDSTPNTDLPGAVAGQLKDKELFVNQPIEPAVAAFGQGFSITPLKLAQLHALIANGGYFVHPHITKDFSYRDTSSTSNDQLFSAEATKTVLEWMETVVEKGSGKGVKTDRYRIGGKTGTADKSDGTSYKAKICSFVAILPIEDPRYVVVVAIDEPKKAYAYGSTVAVPVAKQIIESLIVLEQIPPAPDKTMTLSLKD